MTIDIRSRRARPAAPAPRSTTGAGARDHPSPTARGKASPIRAWRAVEADAGPPPKAADRAPGKAAAAAVSRGTTTGARSGARERAARTRAIERAWKEELARQIQLDAEEQALAQA